MKKLLFLSALLILITSCNKERREAEYIIEVSGDDYADDITVYWVNKVNEADGGTGSKRLNLSGGTATISGFKSDWFKFYFPSYQGAETTPAIPPHQNSGDKIHINAYKSKKGKKGDKVGELDLVCSGFYDDGNIGRIEVDW